MKVRKKRRISPLMKILLIVESVAVALLLVLCVYKNDIPFLSDIFNESKPDVILDAGHGGYDTGCVDGNLQEKDINLSVTLEIGRQLEASGYNVVYIRDSDAVNWASNELDDLRYRANISNESGAKLYVSIHVNSEEESNGSYGYEVWGKLKQDGVFDLAKNILDSVTTLGYSQNRGMKDQDGAPLYVLQNNRVPAVLFELGFIGSEVDQVHLRDGNAQKQMSHKIAEGIKKTLDDIKKAEEMEKNAKT